MSDVKEESARKFASCIEGWLTDQEGEFLYKVARQCSGEGVIVEIGSWKGKSTIWLGRGALDGNKVKVYAIDPHAGYCKPKTDLSDNSWSFDIFKENIISAGVNEIITPILKTSQEAAEGWNIPIEFLFIDGAHEYELVEKDFVSWFPHLIENGVLAVHGTTSCLNGSLCGFPGPKKVVDKFIFKTSHFSEVGVIDTITYARKGLNQTWRDRLKIRVVRMKKYFPDLVQFLFLHVSKLPRPVRSLGRKLLKL